MLLGWIGRQGVRESILQASGMGTRRRAETFNISSHFDPIDFPWNWDAPRNNGILSGNLLQERLNGKQYNNFASLSLFI